ncbi:uncharacterized protein LOC134778914 [Penaeus indicus]|uniref:uncharacterized protein LOC134778914 n=1 Tax=Penaeus indicus TaxID=29960 RepID=UPI00300CC606
MIAPGDIRRLQLDYILVTQRYRTSVKNSCSFPGADVDSDHNLVLMKVRLKLKKMDKAKPILKWDREKLKNNTKEYALATNTELTDNIQTNFGVESRWNRLKSEMTKGAESTVGKVKRKRAKKPWVTDGMLEKMDERRKWKNVNTDERKSNYRKLNNELRRETDKAREDWLEEECKEI